MHPVTQSKKVEWIDITYPIQDQMTHWPHQPDVEIKKLYKIDEDSKANVTTISCSVHTGTHMDAPLHFLKGAKDITSFPPDIAIGKVRVIDTGDAEIIDDETLIRHPIQEGERILFKTSSSDFDWTKEPFKSKFTYCTLKAATYLAQKKVKLVGIDYLSISNDEDLVEVHKCLLGQDIWILEGLDLRNVSAGNYEMICLPMKISGADGAPARVLIKPA